jgi:hypothetical protein
MRLAVLGFALMISPAMAADEIAANYDISLGGARVMKASYNATIGKDEYQAALDAKSVGMSKWLSKIRLNLSAQGTMDGGTLVPASYNYARKKNDKNKKRNLSFSGGELVTTGADYDAKILSALDGKVLDPLTMLLKLGRSEKPCSGKHRAFDGRDVFDIKLSNGGNEGDRVTCKAVYTPVAGGDVDDGDTDPQNYEITLAPLGGDRGFIPIRITGTTKGVGFEVSATAVSLNGAALSY